VAALVLVAAAGAGCGGDGGTGSSNPVFTSLEVTPSSTTLFTVAPGNTVALTLAPKDQDGHTMSGALSPTFESDNTGVAEVTEDGTITAVAAGTAHITTSLTLGGVTKTASTTVTSQVAPATAEVVAPQIAFVPGAADVAAGGSVTWTFESIHHTVTFSTPGSPADVPELQDGSASRTFPTNGTFAYQCSIHPTMTGVVRVH
jgi:plastocyanin